MKHAMTKQPTRGAAEMLGTVVRIFGIFAVAGMLAGATPDPADAWSRHHSVGGQGNSGSSDSGSGSSGWSGQQGGSGSSGSGSSGSSGSGYSGSGGSGSSSGGWARRDGHGGGGHSGGYGSGGYGGGGHSVPEIDPSTLALALGIAAGGLAILRDRRRR